MNTSFVNRDAELRAIEEMLVALQRREELTLTPIIQFHGVGGIGKTTMLKRVQQYCHERHVANIWADASQGISRFSQEMMRQVKKPGTPFVSRDTDDARRQLIEATKLLLLKGPVAMLLDSLDVASDEHLKWIELFLRELVENNKLFVVLASKRKITFEQTRPIARRLMMFQLQQLERRHCQMYLESTAHSVEPEVRDVIFEWTQGYPLAMNVMIEAVTRQQLDPRKEDDQKQLLDIITQRVINKGVLADVLQSEAELEWYRTILSLLSVARRAIMPIIQKLIERFATQYRMPSLLAYMTLPKQINRATEVLNWQPAKSGYAVEAPIRPIFQVKLRLEDPERYYAIHTFLAEVNREYAAGVSGLDRTRYLQEYLYHSAQSMKQERGLELAGIVESTVQQIIEEMQGEPTRLQEFQEEFTKDEELQVVLGEHTNVVQSLLIQAFARMYRQSALDLLAVSEEESCNYLHEFFRYVVQDPLVGDRIGMVKEQIQDLKAQIPSSVRMALHTKLIQDEDMKVTLEEDIEVFADLINDEPGA